MEQQRSEQDSSVGDALALALRCARFCSASLILFASYSLAPLLMRPLHFARSCAICSHHPIGMLKSFKDFSQGKLINNIYLKHTLPATRQQNWHWVYDFRKSVLYTILNDKCTNALYKVILILCQLRLKHTKIAWFLPRSFNSANACGKKCEWFRLVYTVITENFTTKHPTMLL